MVEEDTNPETLLSQAKEREKECDWLGAVDLCGRALEMFTKEDVLRVGEIQETIAYALFRGAMQAENIGEFKSRLSETAKQYELAKQSYVTANRPESSPRASRCEAMITYLGFWQSPEVEAKKRSVNEAWSLAKKAMDTFPQDEISELAKTYNQLFHSAVLSLHFSDDPKVRKTIVDDGIAYGERVVGLLSEARDQSELPSVLPRLAGLLTAAGVICVLSADEHSSRFRRASENWQKALELNEELASVAMTDAAIAYVPYLMSTVSETLRHAARMLDASKKTGDRLAMGVAIGSKAFLDYWTAVGAEDPEEAKTLLDKCLESVKETRRQFEIIGFVTPDYFTNIWFSSPSAPWYFDELATIETDMKRKLALVEECLEAARAEFISASQSGYPYVVDGSHYSMGLALFWMAKMETDREKRANLLKETIQHRTEGCQHEKILMPSSFWNRAVYHCLLGETELELANVADDEESRRASLDSSISNFREGLDLFQIEVSTFFSVGGIDQTNYWRMCNAWRIYGKALQRSYALGGARETLADSAIAFEKAAELGAKGGMPSRAAEGSWEAARAYDSMSDYLKASARFEEAAEQYRIASAKIKSLSGLYREQSSYMKAWSEIEKAKYHHARQEPAVAMKCYDKAAELHESAGKWSFLSPNYLAWARVEKAEDLSQKERSKDSIDAFTEAARLFKDSETSMFEPLNKIESLDEKQMVENLIQAANRRQEFCRARIALEEARLLDKEGELGSASEKYGLATDMFSNYRRGLTSDRDQKEIELIITLSKAWKAMAKAEAESSPELYEEAARLFDEAKNLSPGDKTKNLAMGHSRFCRALQAGVNFSDTGDLAQHDLATNNLESAAKYYMKAGLGSASEFARASRLLFDAYVHMGKASMEADHEKKTKLYALAEKILQASAASYEKADQPGKKEQVLKILATVQQDKELAVSLTEVLRAPDAVSTTMAFSSPTPTHETAVGLDRYEHADVQATLIIKPKELLVDEALTLEIELVNAGRGVAQLTKVDKVIPEGFEVAEEPQKYRIEDSYLNMKGRRLDALKTEDVKLSLKPKSKGQFTVKPRIMYLDESGKYKSFELEPVVVTVKELGISGWLRGSEKKK